MKYGSVTHSAANTKVLEHKRTVKVRIENAFLSTPKVVK